MKKAGFIFLFIIHFSFSLLSQQKDSFAVYYSQYIKSEQLSEYLHQLASDEYEGRETGKTGQKKAADYIAGQFKKAGIQPFNKESYFQYYSLETLRNSPIVSQQATVNSGNTIFELDKDYCLLQGRTPRFLKQKDILFAGYGIDDSSYNDYKGLKTSEQILMVLDGEPFSTDSISFITHTNKPSEWTTYYRKKIESAYKKEVSVLLIVSKNFDRDLQVNKTKLPFIKTKRGKEELPVMYISEAMANSLLKNTTVEKLEKEIKTKRGTVSKKIKAEITIEIKNSPEKLESENVLGFIEGSDLKDELVVISAHYDHLGKEGNIIYYGADDDASGTSAIINIAKAFSQAKKEGHGPRRSILCIAFSGEEKGLLGSNYYVNHPEFPLKNTVCDLNIDMIGRKDEKYNENPDYIYVIGSDKLSTELHQINERINNIYSNLKLDYTYNDDKDINRFYYRSDHYNFAKNGIPVIFYFNGVHEDYHKETDTADKIDFKKMEKITRFIFYTAWELANRNERLKVDVK